jgi:hypothetical protein
MKANSNEGIFHLTDTDFHPFWNHYAKVQEWMQLTRVAADGRENEVY